jgi:lipopolysaccharide biosynthesis glycosyltransferase
VVYREAVAVITLATMFDSGYMRKGLALIESLRRHVPDFALCILALDSQVYDYFEQHKQRGVVVVSLKEVETWELIEAKHDRKWVEYIWTLTPHLTRFCFDLLDTDSVAYIDADCFLFGPLSQLYDEVGGASCAIIPHRWTPYQANRLRSAGIYNVSWVYFNRQGLHCLEDWREKCIEWCYWRVEADGRFADQGYLNDWPTRHNAHVVQHLGANLAPWNQEQYTYQVNGSGLTISDSKRTDPLLFYHFHGYRSPQERTGYPLHPMVAKHVYEPYEAALCST